jgi:hypothetical protein
MTNELEKIWKEAIMVKPRDYRVVILEGLVKIAKNLSQDSPCPCRD